MSDTDLKEKEAAGIDPKAFENEFGKSFSDDEKAGLDKLNDQFDGGLYKPSKERKRAWLTGKKAGIGAGITGILIGGTFGVLSILQGPLQIVHFSQLLERFHFTSDQEFMDGRAGKLIKYARTRNTPERRNLSYLGNKIADRYETKLRTAGMEPVYEGGRTGRLNAIDIDTSTPGGRQVLEDMHRRGVPDLSIRPDGKLRIDLSGTNAATRRKVLAGMVDSLELAKISSVTATRVLKIRGQVDFHPLKNISRRADEKLFDFVKRRQAQSVDENRNGATDAPGDVTPEGTDADNDPSNNPPDAGEAAKEADDILGGLPDPDAPTPDIEGAAGSFKGKLAKGAGAAGAVALVCGLYKLGESIPDLKYFNLVAPLIRIGVQTVAMGNQVMSGQGFNAEELGAMTKNLYQAERIIHDSDGSTHKEPASSWSGARSVQAENGQPATGPDMPDGAKPNTNSPQFFQVLSNTINSIPGGATVCNAVTSTAGGWAIDIFSWATSAAGPVGFALNAATDVATGAAVGHFMGDLVRWLVGAPLATDAAGALFGNYANYGARLASNDAAIAHGGMALSAAQTAALNAERDQHFREVLQHDSLYARYFDIKQPDSLLARAAFNPSLNEVSNPSAAFATMVRQPFTLFSKLTNIFGAQAFAQTSSTYDYGFPKFGFSIEERDADENDDPMAIADRVEPNLASLNDKYGKCFNMTVNPSTFTLQSENQSFRYDHLDDPGYEQCSNRNNRELTDYRFYLADLSTAKAMTCYEGLDETTCAELGFSAGQATGITPGVNSTSGTATGSNIYMIGDSLSVGMRDAGKIGEKFTANGWGNVCVEAQGSRPLAGTREFPPNLLQNPIDCRGQASTKYYGLGQIDHSPDKEAIAAASTIVVALGTNDGPTANTTFRDNVNAMIDKLKAANPTAKIYWVNTYLAAERGTGGNYTRTDFDTMNRILSEQSRAKGFTVIDWHSVAPANYGSVDAIHPTNYQAMAQYVVGAVGTAKVSLDDMNSLELASTDSVPGFWSTLLAPVHHLANSLRGVVR